MTITIWLAMAQFAIGVFRLQKFPTSQAACEASSDKVVYKLEVSDKENLRQCCDRVHDIGTMYHEDCIDRHDICLHCKDLPATAVEVLSPFECISAPAYTVKPL